MATRDVMWAGKVLGPVEIDGPLSVAQRGSEALEYCYVHWPAMQPVAGIKVRIVVRAIAQALLGQSEEGDGDMFLEQEIIELYAARYPAWLARLETFFYAAKLGQPGITADMVLARAKR